MMTATTVDTSRAFTKPWLVDFRSLQKEIKRRGFYERNTALVLAHLFAHLATAASGLALFTASSSVGVKIFACVLATLGLLGIATHTHNSAHYTSTNSRRLDAILGYLGYSVTFGVAVTFWQHRHNVIHHRNPNILGTDKDFAFVPVFAVTDRERASAVGLSSFYYKYLQVFLWPVIISLNVSNMQRNGLTFVLRQLWAGEQPRRPYWIDLACCSLHFCLWLVIPSLWLDTGAVILFYVLHNVVFSHILFLVLGSSHLPRVAACATACHSDAVLKQTATTLNLNTGLYCRFLLSGLDYQLEHHLFPGVSYNNLPRVNKLVREYCDHHGYPHHTLGIFEAAFGVVSIFYHPKQLLDNLDNCSLDKNRMEEYDPTG